MSRGCGGAGCVLSDREGGQVVGVCQCLPRELTPEDRVRLRREIGEQRAELMDLRNELARHTAESDGWWARAREAATGDAEGGGPSLEAFVENLAALRADRDRLAPRQRAGQRIFNAVYALDQEFADSVRATNQDPFYNDALCETFLYAWAMRMKDRRDAGEPFVPDPRCASCGQGVACQESCCAATGADGLLRHNECLEPPHG